jgi:hypothetical protein
MRAPGSGPRIRLLMAATLALTLIPAAAFGGDDGKELAEIRAATARFHRVETAIEAGYELGYNGMITGCIADPTYGAMGYHYFNQELMDDPAVDATAPEGLVYAPGPNGKLRLVAVEWVVPGEIWDGPGAPSVLGRDLHVLNPALGWWIMHAWVWKHNPAGMFEDWNPEVVCP